MPSDKQSHKNRKIHTQGIDRGAQQTQSDLKSSIKHSMRCSYVRFNSQHPRLLFIAIYQVRRNVSQAGELLI